MKDLPPQYKNIVQFSPVRSGSTLIYNILKRCELDVPIIKDHNFSYSSKNFYVTTIRHPFDSIISYCLKDNLPLSRTNLAQSAQDYLLYGGSALLSPSIAKSNVLLLYYQRFVSDLDYAFDSLEKFLNISISYHLRTALKKDLHIDTVQTFTKRFRNFKTYDLTTHWHGNHISQYKGKTDFKKILNKKQLSSLQAFSQLQLIINQFFPQTSE